VLRAGESIYFDSSTPHAYVALGTSACRALGQYPQGPPLIGWAALIPVMARMATFLAAHEAAISVTSALFSHRMPDGPEP
jgi:hypothetical protein